MLTPAEEETRTFSERFSGHMLTSRVAAALFSSRGWRPGEIGQKAMPAFGLRACVLFSDVWHYFSEHPTANGGRIFNRSGRRQGGGRRADLAAAFRTAGLAAPEAMRDADLVVSVAQSGQQGYFSSESCRSRTETVGVLIEQLGIRVRDDRRALRPRGGQTGPLPPAPRHRGGPHRAGSITSASSRTAVSPRGSRSMPFAEGSDPKVAELLSKTFLLISDDQITDASILGQIKAAQGEGRENE